LSLHFFVIITVIKSRRSRSRWPR